MKTTIEIADPLFEQAKALAADQGVTLRSLVEAGLARVIADRRRPPTAFRLRDASFCGRGLQREFAEGEPAAMLEAAYEGRG